VVAVLVAWTPLFDVIVSGWLDAPDAIARWVRPGMRIMVFWSAAIGWRRFLQGILIRYNQTRQVAYGTVARLAASGGAVALLAVWGEWPGVVIGSVALMAGVLAEAVYATIATRPVVRRELAQRREMAHGRELTTTTATPAPNPRLTYSALARFHLPLAATSLLILLMQPLVTSSLARLERPTESLAAWPVLFQILLMSRAAALALPEVVIALHRDDRTFSPLRRFSFAVTAAVTAGLALFAFTPLADWYLFQAQDVAPPVGELVLANVGLFILFPGFAAISSWLRGLLIQSRHTRYVNVGMAFNLLMTAGVLFLGVARQWPGLPTVAVALNLAAAVEVVYLLWRARLTLPVGVALLGRPNAQPSQL
jgi:hypothetical protein